MKFILPEKRFAKALLTAFFAALLLSTGLQAQTRKKTTATPAKKTSAKQQAKSSRSSTVSKKKEAVSKKADKRSAAQKKADARSAKNTKTTKTTRNSKVETSRTARNSGKDTRKDTKKPDKKMSAKERRAEAARKKAEEKRRLAAIAEQRRREEAARIARERKLAFERGLKDQTAQNILKDNLEGEDLAIRRAAIDALGNRAGTVVVMEAKTGKIVSMVNQEWAVKNSFKPCSTIKLVTGVAGLNERVINSEGGIGASTSGWDLDMALARSANPYFQKTGVNFGNEKMIKYAKDLGLGERTGINVEGETPGKLPFGNRNPRIYSHGDDFEVTPLQLAVMVSAITNDGKRVVPQVARKSSANKASFQTKFRGHVSVPNQTMQGVIPGMIGAAEYGTARRGVDQGMGIAGKTGSCIFKGSWIGLFASVAPVEDPQYSVVVITRGESERGKYAAAVAGNVYRALASRLRRDQERYVALKNLRPTPPPVDLASADDEEEDDIDTAVASEKGQNDRNVIIAGSAERDDAPKKLVQRTTQSRPTATPAVVQVKPSNSASRPVKKVSFPPVVIEFDKNKAAGTRERIVKN